MGCICSKRGQEENSNDNDNSKDGFYMDKDSSVQLVAPSHSKNDDISVGKKSSSHHHHHHHVVELEESSHKKNNKSIVEKKPDNIVSIGGGSPELGWPPWLTSVAGEAVKGWLPRRVESYEKLEKIGQGTYSSVYKGRDLETGKLVAMKKVRFVNMDPESVRFMAREIIILRRLNHPNVMKLEAIVTSKMSCSLYLVFEYMEHDLSGLAATPGIKFTQPQIKCYMQQLVRGLEYCHSRGVLHRDIKGSNLLIDNNGVLKIADFGLATFFQPDQKQPLTSRVVTLWYRPPELLLGATQYGVAVDLWSVGCIIAELFAGKPIMPGRTEVEQMHKIFKLCGSPSEEYWKKTKLPLATSFKPHQPYKRCISEAFRNFPSSALSLVDKLLAMEPEERGSASSALRSQFFTTEPFPCAPSQLPKFPPSKELDAKRREEEARRERADSVKGQRKTSNIHNHKYNHQHIEDGSTSTGFRMDPHINKVMTSQNCLPQSSSMIHPSAVGSWNKNKPQKNNGIGSELRTQMSLSLRSQATSTSCTSQSQSHKKDDRASSNEEPASASGYVAKKNMIHYSGPLIPPGGNIDDILKEHERQIQQAVRKAREKSSGNGYKYTQLHQNGILYGQLINDS